MEGERSNSIRVDFSPRDIKRKSDTLAKDARQKELLWMKEVFCVDTFPVGKVESRSWEMTLGSVSNSTAVKYVKAIRKFHEFWHNLSPSQRVIASAEELDMEATDYGAFLVKLPNPPSCSAFGHLYSGLAKFFPATPFRRLSMSLKAYANIVPSNKGLPIPAWLVGLLIGYFVRLKTQRGVLCAVLCWCLFDTLARINELILLPGSRLKLTEGACHGTQTLAMLALKETKTGDKSVALTDAALVSVLSALKDQLKDKANSLFRMSYDVFTNEFYEALRILGFQHAGFTLHSFRHGGATHLKLLGWKVEDIKLRGGWESKAFKIYLSELDVCSADTLAQLQAANPTRTADLIKRGIEFYEKRHLLFKALSMC